MKKAISKINPFRYAKKLHIGYIWLIAVLLLLVVGVICSGAKVYKYSPILSVVSYSLAAISLIAIIIMIVRKTSDMKIQSELDKYILVLNEHKDDQEWLHKELTYVNLRIYNKTNGHLYRCKKKLLEEYKNEANNESVAEELMVTTFTDSLLSLPKAGFLKSVVAKVEIWYPLPASAAGLQALIYPKTASGKTASSSRKKDCPLLS